MRGRVCGVLALVVMATLPVLGQAPAAKTNPAAISKPAPLERLPYMAEFKILRVRVFPNGTETDQSTITTARDSQGRHMTATTANPTSADQKATTHFHVFDPVAHVTFSWSFPGREAMVMAIPFSGAIPPGCSYGVFGISSANEKTTVGDLGTTTILGVEARGRRFSTTATIEPIGKHKEHNRQGSTIEVRSSELWQAVAPGLTGLVVRQVSEDAQSGKTSRELVKFSQTEPDSAVFHPPIGYEIVNREVNADACVSFEDGTTP